MIIEQSSLCISGNESEHGRPDCIHREKHLQLILGQRKKSETLVVASRLLVFRIHEDRRNAKLLRTKGHPSHGFMKQSGPVPFALQSLVYCRLTQQGSIGSTVSQCAAQPPDMLGL